MTRNALDQCRWALRQSLCVQKKHNVGIVHDETRIGLADVFSTAATQLGAQPHLLCIPRQQQHAFDKDPDTMRSVRALIAKCSRLIVLQERSELSNAFRFFVLTEAEKGRRRTASMPGVDLDNLQACRGDLESLIKRCDQLADRMLWAQSVILTTIDQLGRSHTLNIPITTHLPIASSGKVPAGSWSNVPSGETFVVPDVYVASGSVVINGSVLKHVISPSNALTLTIRQGRVQPPTPDQVRQCPQLWELLFNSCGEEKYTNSTVLSEFGVGLNRHIEALTGLPIFDEKKAGTIHLGFGKSKQFRGPTPCKVHNDFVITNATVFFDDECVMKSGQDDWDTVVALPDFNRLCIRDNLKDSCFILTDPALAQEAKVQGRHHLSRRWRHSRSGGQRLTPVGSSDLAWLACQIKWKLAPGKSMTFDEIYDGIAQASSKNATRPLLKERVAQSLEALIRFGLVTANSEQ